MNTEAKSQVHEILLSRRHVIANDWYRAIAQTSFVPHSMAEVRQRLVQLTDQAMALLLTEPFERGQAEAIGASLASLHYLQPVVLGQTQEILARQLVEGLPAHQITALQPRLAELLGGVAAGFFQQARETILTEQEQIRSALITELRQGQEALRKAYDEVEDKVQERTAELRAANKSLRREIAQRQQAEEALRESEEKYRHLVERANDGICIIQDTMVKYGNLRLAEMWGGAVEEIIGTPFTDYVHPDELPKVAARYQRRMAGEEVTPLYETVLRRKDGGKVHVELNAGVVTYQGKPADLVIVRDITERRRAEEELERYRHRLEELVEERTAELRAEIAERKQAEEALRESEETARALLNAAIEMAVLIDTNGTILALNKTAAKSLGKSKGENELIGLCVYDLFPPAVARYRKAQAEKVLHSGSPLRFEDKRGGRYFDSSLYPILDAQGRIARIAVFARDITHRKRAEGRIRSYQQRLRSLASQLSLAEEQERRDIATALHDRVGQALAICKIKLGALRKSAFSTEFAEPLDEIHQFIEEIIRDTRSLTFELSSPILYQLGLEAALEWLTEQNQKRYGIPSEFKDDRQPKPLDDDVRILLFQAVRELLTNVAKHAQAQSVKVTMQRVGRNVQIGVEDDGVGFDPFPIGSHWSEIKGFGLFSIRERLNHLGGHFKITSKPGHGTQITLVAPLKREEISNR